MLEFNRQGYNKTFEVYETYYMAQQAIRRERKKTISALENGIRKIYQWKIMKVNIFIGETVIETYKPTLQLTTMKEDPLR